jgi:membrane fusion protein (multidrug efflux system)
LGILVVLVAGAILAGLIMFLPKKDDSKPTLPPEPIPVNIEVVKPLDSLEDNMELYGRVEPDKVVEVAAEVSARVRSYAGRQDKLTKDFRIIASPASTPVVEEGDRVKKGQPLLYLDTDLVLASRNQAKADYDFKLLTHNRVIKLAKRNVATAAEVDQCVMALDVAKARLDETEALLERTFIVSPIDGILNRLPVDIGEYVLPGTIIAEIVDMDTVDVVFDISELDIGYMKLGGKVTILCGDDKTQGVIKYISALADPSTRTTIIKVSVDNSKGKFHTGQFVMAELTREVLGGVIMIPLRAVIPLENGKAVYVVRNGKTIRQDVVIDMPYIDGRVRVVSGLKGGEKLIVSGSNQLEPNRTVKIIPEEGTRQQVSGNRKDLDR